MKILIISNNRGLLSFRRELIESSILKGYEVVFSSPSDAFYYYKIVENLRKSSYSE